MADPPSPRVSVIIPTRNRAARLPPLLDRLAAQTLSPVEVIFVDESTDDAAERAVAAWRAARPGFPVRWARVTLGSLTRSRNHGVAMSAGEYVSFLDDDMAIPPDFLAAMAATLERLGPAYAGGAALQTTDPEFRPKLPKYQAMRKLFGLGHFADGRFLANGMATLPREWGRVSDTEFVPGGGNLFRRAVAAEYRFDDAMSGYANFDDVDFSWRVSRRHKLFFNPECVVYHADDQDKKGTRAARRQFCRIFARNYLYVFRKNIPLTAAAGAGMAWVLVGLLLLSVRRRLLSELLGYLQGIGETLRDGPHPV